MVNLQIVPVNNKIDTINDPEVIETKRKKEEDKAIKRINKFMLSLRSELYFTVRDSNYPYNPTTEFFEEIKKQLESEGYICTFDKRNKWTWFIISLPENRVNIPLENFHEKRKLVLVK